MMYIIINTVITNDNNNNNKLILRNLFSYYFENITFFSKSVLFFRQKEKIQTLFDKNIF